MLVGTEDSDNESRYEDMPTYPLWPFSRFYLFIYLTRWHHIIVMV